MATRPLPTVSISAWPKLFCFANVTSDLVGNQSREDNDTFPIQSGAGFYHVTSPVYEQENQTWVQQEKGRMHMIIIDSGKLHCT